MGAFQQRLQRMKDEGVAEGITEGKTLGIAEGKTLGVAEREAAILIRLATRRFGTLPEWAQVRLQEANTKQLEIWADRILDANQLEDLFAN